MSKLLVPADPLLLNGYLTRNALRFPDKIALAQQDRSVTFAQLEDRVNRLANAMRALGVQQGDPVSMLMYNNIEQVECMLAAIRLGAIATPVNFRLTVEEITRILSDVQPGMVVTEPELGAAALAAGNAAGSVKTYVMVDGNGSEVISGVVKYSDLLAGASPDPVIVDINPQDAAFILHTSGTTGSPKGAMLGHAGCVINSLNVIARLRISDTSEWRHLGVPLFHSGGVNTVMQQLVLGGSTFISESATFDPRDIVDVFEKHSIATAFLTPTQWQQVCAVPGLGARKLALRRLVWGTSHTPPDVLRAMSESFAGVPIFAQFGQTEMSGTTCTLDAEFAATKLGSVGRPLGHVQLRLVDEGMADVAPGEVGEVVYQGPSVMRGYWRNEAATADAFRGGWFHSGDLARYDEDGFLFVVDRLKDMIISGGENIYCLEVETALRSHPKVADVVVVGVPHNKWVETPHAVIVPTVPTDGPTLSELQEFLKSRLASYKKPTSLQLVDALPRNSLGKVLRKSLRLPG
ncbi:AMP-binding protein [Nocardia neocaledoniensis]|uniref:AMP-binding protein n=1 Tax=Nocardia neocaledoniensis TaxID=236511 RepID=UPI002457274B|nr:AMP-binding protein [Nocardia neocaledoniensis]